MQQGIPGAHHSGPPVAPEQTADILNRHAASGCSYRRYTLSIRPDAVEAHHPEVERLHPLDQELLVHQARVVPVPLRVAVTYLVRVPRAGLPKFERVLFVIRLDYDHSIRPELRRLF